MSGQSVKEVLYKSSKDLGLKAGKMSMANEAFYNELLDLSLSNEKPYGWRAAWAVMYLSEIHPEKVRPQLRRFAKAMPQLQNHSQLAAFLRIFKQIEFDCDEFGDLLDHCLILIKTPQKRAYVQVLAIQIIVKFCKAYPELNEEIIDQIKLARENFELPYLLKITKKILPMLENESKKLI